MPLGGGEEPARAGAFGRSARLRPREPGTEQTSGGANSIANFTTRSSHGAGGRASGFENIPGLESCTSCRRPRPESLHRHALGQVARLVDVATARDRNMVG